MFDSPTTGAVSTSIRWPVATYTGAKIGDGTNPSGAFTVIWHGYVYPDAVFSATSCPFHFQRTGETLNWFNGAISVGLQASSILTRVSTTGQTSTQTTTPADPAFDINAMKGQKVTIAIRVDMTRGFDVRGSIYIGDGVADFDWFVATGSHTDTLNDVSDLYIGYGPSIAGIGHLPAAYSLLLITNDAKTHADIGTLHQAEINTGLGCILGDTRANHRFATCYGFYCLRASGGTGGTAFGEAPVATDVWFLDEGPSGGSSDGVESRNAAVAPTFAGTWTYVNPLDYGYTPARARVAAGSTTDPRALQLGRVGTSGHPAFVELANKTLPSVARRVGTFGNSRSAYPFTDRLMPPLMTSANLALYAAGIQARFGSGGHYGDGLMHWLGNDLIAGSRTSNRLFAFVHAPVFQRPGNGEDSVLGGSFPVSTSTTILTPASTTFDADLTRANLLSTTNGGKGPGDVMRFVDGQTVSFVGQLGGRLSRAENINTRVVALRFPGAGTMGVRFSSYAGTVKATSLAARTQYGTSTDVDLDATATYTGTVSSYNAVARLLVVSGSPDLAAEGVTPGMMVVCEDGSGGYGFGNVQSIAGDTITLDFAIGSGVNIPANGQTMHVLPWSFEIVDKSLPGGSMTGSAAWPAVDVTATGGNVYLFYLDMHADRGFINVPLGWSGNGITDQLGARFPTADPATGRNPLQELLRSIGLDVLLVMPPTQNSSPSDLTTFHAELVGAGYTPDQIVLFGDSERADVAAYTAVEDNVAWSEWVAQNAESLGSVGVYAATTLGSQWSMASAPFVSDFLHNNSLGSYVFWNEMGEASVLASAVAIGGAARNRSRSRARATPLGL